MNNPAEDQQARSIWALLGLMVVGGIISIGVIVEIFRGLAWIWHALF